jgi:glycosyltransferase involved in cell wall biosynthesis
MTPRRVLYVHPCAGMGGAPLSLLYLIEHLDRTRYTPEVLFLGAPGEEVELYRSRGIPFRLRSDITTFPHARGAYLSLRSLRPWEILTRPVQILPSARHMRDELRVRPVDLVHLNTSVLVPAGLGASWAGVPVVWHVRESLHPGFTGMRRALVRSCIDRCSRAIIAISHDAAGSLLESDKVHVIYNFVKFEAFDRALDGRRFRSAVGIAPEAQVVMMLGGLVESKGADVFVAAADLVRKSAEGVRFIIAGMPPGGESPSRIKRALRRVVEGTGFVPNMQRRVLRTLRALRLEETIQFVGMRLDVPDMLAAADVVVWPATVSHFARPILEAGAMARPVVAAGFPASREIVLDGETGILFPPRDAAALAEGILRLLRDRDLASRMGEAGYRLARERYDAPRAVAAIMDIYDEVLGSRDGGSP